MCVTPGAVPGRGTWCKQEAGPALFLAGRGETIRQGADSQTISNGSSARKEIQWVPRCGPAADVRGGGGGGSRKPERLV